MKKLIITISVISLGLLSGCATNTSSQKGLKKSPCACLFQPIQTPEDQLSQPYEPITKLVKNEVNVV